MRSRRRRGRAIVEEVDASSRSNAPGGSAGSAPIVVGRYELHAVIASGGMATVHFGRLNGPGGFARTVAVKRLHQHFAKQAEFVSMFVDEARLASKIRHPNVVPILDVVAEQDELFLVMEYVQGETLARLLSAMRAKNTRPPPRVVSAVMSGVLHGLHAAHEARHPVRGPLGIVHRDVSPQNVIVGVDGTARLLDFGVAKAVHRLQITREGQLKGKVPYMSPEQISGGEVTRLTDVFAASVVLWESLTARRLFAADRETQVIAKILKAPVDPPSKHLANLLTTIDSATYRSLQELDAVVLRGLERDPTQRWQTAREMALALEAAVTPAAPSEVGEWVENNAKGALDERSYQLAQLASSASINRFAPPPEIAPPRPQGPFASRTEVMHVSPPSSRGSGEAARSRRRRRRARALDRVAPVALAIGVLGLVAFAASLVYLVTTIVRHRLAVHHALVDASTESPPRATR